MALVYGVKEVKTNSILAYIFAAQAAAPIEFHIRRCDDDTHAAAVDEMHKKEYLNQFE